MLAERHIVDGMKKQNSKQLLTYSTLVVPLIKAVQELTAKVEALENK